MSVFYITIHVLLYFPLKKISIIKNCLISIAIVSCVLMILIDYKKTFLFYFCDIISAVFIIFFF